MRYLILISCLFSASFAQSGFSPELQEAIDFCGSLTALTEGNCPPKPSAPIPNADKTFKGAKNIKLCKPTDVPGLVNPQQLWTQTKLKFVGLNAHFNEEKGRYALSSGSFLMAVNFTAPKNVDFLVGRAVGILPELPRKESFERDICSPFFQDPCKIRASGQSRCPLVEGNDVNLAGLMESKGNFYPDLPVDLRFEIYESPVAQPNQCVTQETLSQYGEPLICFIIPGYIQ